ncbi:MAG: thylakoid membrane photosystem I accumulation factor [Elainellaceae cyanobacterium]
MSLLSWFVSGCAFVISTFQRWLRLHRAIAIRSIIVGLISVFGISSIAVAPAIAELTDDRYDGNIFALYAGNGSLIPPRLSLKESLKRGDRPTLLVFYIPDSRDCKEYASVVSQVDAFYGRAADLIAVNVDTIFPKATYEPIEPGYYYEGLVPQTVLLNQSGEVVFNEIGNTPFERIDDTFREVFDLLPRSKSVELKRKQVNEVNTELVEEDDAS